MTDPLVAALRAAGCVFAEDEAELLRAAADGAALEALVARRVAGEPLETILGWVEFSGLRLVVAPGVFVPRRRSQLLVTETVRWAPPGAQVVELCAGIGAIAAAVVEARPDLDVVAAEIDERAVACARANLGDHRVFAGDLFDALPETLRGRIHVLVANAPYVPTGEIGLMPQEARLHEPRIALDGGPDGLDVHRRIAAGLRAWLTPGGAALIETSLRQAPETARILETGGCTRTDVVRDDDLQGTVVRGRLSTTNPG
jgi:release factor glutamine methyltransferase